MGLIPQDFINDLLERVDVSDVVGARIELKKAGREYKALCPFHGEKTPSFHVVPDKGFYHCFGCGAHGTALTFLLEHDRLEFVEAVEALASMAGVEVPREEGPRRRDDRRSKLLDIVDRADRYYRQQLRQHPERARAVEYLKGRGLDGETARTFGIGYAPPGYHNLAAALGGGDDLMRLMEEAGLVARPDDGREPYDRFRDRIVFPIRDTRGRTIGFGGRVLGDGKPKYLNSPETPLFHKGQELYGLFECRRAVRDPDRVLLVEGYMDVVGLAQAGIRECCAALGTAATDAHLKKLFRLAPEVVFCFDGDAAGRRAADKAVRTALDVLEDGVSVRLLFLPDGEDPDTLVRKEGEAAFRARLAKAVPFSEYLFDALSEELDLDVLDGRSRLADRALPLIDRIPGPVLRTLMRSRLTELTRIPPSELDGILRARRAKSDTRAPTAALEPLAPEAQPVERFASPPRDAGRSAPAGAGRRGRHDVGRLRRSRGATAAVALLNCPDLAAGFDEAQLLRMKRAEREDWEVLIALLERLAQAPDTSTAALVAEHTGTPLHAELVRLVERDRLLDEDGLRREFADAIVRIDEEAIQARRTVLKARIAAREATDAEIAEHFALKRAAVGLDAPPPPPPPSAATPATDETVPTDVPASQAPGDAGATIDPEPATRRVDAPDEPPPDARERGGAPPIEEIPLADAYADGPMPEEREAPPWAE